MSRAPKPRVSLATQMAEQTSNTDDMLAVLEPFVADMLKTLGKAGAEGDIKAAVEGLSVYMKLREGATADKGRRLISEIMALRSNGNSNAN